MQNKFVLAFCFFIILSCSNESESNDSEPSSTNNNGTVEIYLINSLDDSRGY
ncbi:MAG: hypothetical protein HN595_04425, partial [Flavobacteriaceae bacterium]|nr:hypothetical protein [Flavobacteriaceae bacterium]